MSKNVQHGTSGDSIYNRDTQFYHQVTQFFIGLHNFIIGLQNFSSGYAILVPGNKFHGGQFEVPGYTRTVGGRHGLSCVYEQFGDQGTLNSYNGSYFLKCYLITTWFIIL